MLRSLISRGISGDKKRAIKSKYNKLKIFLVNIFLSYDSDALKDGLKKLGIKDTDTILVHANFNADNGFKGEPLDIVNVLVDLVGTNGNLMMVSIPFRGTTYDYLKKNKPFKINKTISLMGLITEMYRRKEGVLRSFHPTHPVLVYGKDRAWLTADHEKCLYPCGVGSPFDKFRQLNGKILFFDVGFGAITFFHYVEDILKDKLPFEVYHNDPFLVEAYDKNNNKHVIETYAFSENISRRACKLEEEMEKQHLIKKGKVGNSRFLLVNAEDVVTCQTSMVESGNLPYDI